MTRGDEGKKCRTNRAIKLQAYLSGEGEVLLRELAFGVGYLGLPGLYASSCGLTPCMDIYTRYYIPGIVSHSTTTESALWRG